MASQCSPVGRASHETRRSRKPNLSTQQGAASVARPRVLTVILIAVPPPRHAARRSASETRRLAGSTAGAVGTPAGRREDSSEARGVAGAQAHSLATAPGSVRRGSRSGLAGSAECRSSSGREHLARTQPSPQASSAPQLLHSPAFQCKSFRGHADSTASSASQSPRLRATPGGGWS